MPFWLHQLAGFDAWFALSAIVLPALGGLILWRHERRRLARASELGPTCEYCGYLLIGLTARRCPECGLPFEPDGAGSADEALSAPPRE